MAESIYYSQIDDQSEDIDYEGSIEEETRTMKIDHSRLRKSTSEPPSECRALIDRLKKCSRIQLLEELSKISTWTFGKCELGHWKEVLSIFDAVLEEATDSDPENKWALNCDIKYSNSDKKLLLWILHFTTLLIEHSFSRHTYRSMDKLLALLASSDMSVVLGVLNLLYMFSKRSNFITRMHCDQRLQLISRLHHLAESWGGKENGFGLADCCNSEKPMPPSGTTLHFEFHNNQTDSKESKTKQNMTYIHVEHVDQIRKTPAEIMKGLLALYSIPTDKEMVLFTHVRLAYHFSNYRNRLLCVQARLQALSVLVYANALQDSAHTLLYNGLLEELVELIELKLPYLVEIRSAALRTLTSIIHLDRNPHFPKKPGSRLNNIIDVTGASQYHGFLPVLVRYCISCLTSQTDGKLSKYDDKSEVAMIDVEKVELDDDTADPSKYMEYVSDVGVNSQLSSDLKVKFPLPLATALFSFLYHLASYESGGDALVSCGMMESLLQVINWHGIELEHITFVTRAVRVIDLITNIDMQAFYNHGGLQSFINRLDVEVNLCLKEHSYDFRHIAVDNECERAGPSEGLQEEESINFEFQHNSDNFGKSCLPQRAALLKSMLNFLKKALQDSTFSEHIRHLMEGTLPTSLKHIISNAEYYGPSLFLLATDVVTVYVFQEPSLLSTIQDNGLTDVVLQALLVKDVPATREVLASLPNVFSALCLNARGLASFVKCKPFERLFKVLLSPTYLSAMRKRRSSDPMGDAASNLGNAMDELMRHQPSLKVDATVAIIKLLNELCQLGTDPKYICWRPHSKSEVSPNSTQRSTSNTEGSSDDEEEDDEEETSTSSQNAQTDSQESQGHSSEKTPIALTEYILNVTKFIDAILSNNSTDDHCREFVNQGGLIPLLKILGLPNLPVDCPVTNSAQAVASVCKSILNLAHEPKVLDQGLTQLSEVLIKLKPLYSHLDIPGGSKLLHELASAPHLESAFSTESATPLLHAMGAAHGYVLMFVHVCRTGQNEIRTLSLQHWGSEKGITVLKGLAELYTSLVWESTLLLALCSDDVIPSDCDFGREDMEKLNIPLSDKSETNSDTAGNVASAMEALTTNPQPLMDVDESVSANKPTSQQLKYIKPLLGASSRLGRALAELFGLLVKLCVGSPIRQRRGQNIVATPAFPSPHAQSVATALNSLLANGLNSDKLPPSPVPKFRLTFLICSVGFTSPMLFDEKRYPYHLMLQKFVRLGGQTTFFNTFQWALSAGGIIPPEEGLEHPNLPEGTGEFLDAWLTLLEKMVNPKAILDSPHVITTKSQTAFKSIAFDPLKYLIQIHKLAFEAVMMLWGKKPLPSYGVRMSDSILSILRHILRGEKIIKDRLTKTDDKAGEDAAGSSSTSASSNARTESDVNAENLRQLLDMGFTREHAMEALMNCLSVEQATDYLLSHPPPFSVLESSRGTDIDFSEDDQVIQAIAMSLGELGPSSEAKKKEEVQEDVQPLSETLIDNFTHGALQICLDLIKVIPESVFKVCDLLVTIMKRNGREFRDQLLDDFCKLFTYIYNSYEPAISSSNVEASEFDLFTESENALRLAYYSHLFTLFFEVPSYFDMKGPCGLAVYRAGLVPHFINLIQLAEKNLSKSKKKVTVPKWLTPILLLLDSLGKVAVSTQRKRYMHLVTKRIWKWYDVVSGKWTPYSPTNNKIINEAYWNGEQTARITCGRRRYTISFSNMQQINEESNNNRPICMTPINMTFDKGNDLKLEAYDTMENDQVTLTEKEEKRCIPIPGYSATQSEEIVRSCVKLMKLEIDKDTLHAIMRLCLRLTQNFENAKIFVKEGGISCLIQLKESMTFHGFRPLATLLIRHTFEGPSTLAYAMEKVMRGRALPSTPPPYKELMFMLRSLGSAVSRDPNTFLDVAKATLRVDINSFRRNDEVDTRMPMKTEPSNRTQAPPMKEQESMEVVYELLNSLVQPIEVNQTEEENFEANKQQPSTTTNSRESMCQRASYLLSSDTNSTDILNVDGQEEVRPKITRSSSDNATENKSNHEVGHRPILAKHSVLKILADAVVSYAGVAKLITEYTYKSNVDTVPEDCTCLAFLFDNILPMVEGISDRDCSMMSRNLISGIASCNHSPEAQATLVTEVKAALIRALLMPESTEKHTRLQHITAIILNMIEQCPPVQQVRIFKAQTFNANVNNIARLMLRKGIFNDLARVPHCLDMSSPNFPITINSALKPMECLSKIVNQPVTGNITGNVTKKRQRHNLDDNRTTNSGMTSTEATNAQGEEAVEDTENTEHDLSAVASSLEGNPITSSVHDINDLEEIMDQLLERGPNATMEIDDDTNLGYDHERDATEELMSTDSGESEDEVDEDENEEEENEIDDGEGEENEDDNDDEEEEEDIDEGDDDDDNNYIDFENAVAPNVDRDEDIVMIQYPDDSENDSFPFVRWNNNGLSIRLFEDAGNSTDQSVPPSHPLLVSRHNTESNSGTVTRTQRTNRTRRYQYLPLNTRNANPPVILQRYLVRRLLGPTAQNLHLGSNQMLNSPGLRDSARVVVMDNFGIFPSVEEQIDFVDQSGYLFGPSMMATSNHIPVALHWWKEESRYIDGESMHDIVTYICNKLVPTLLKHRNAELNERKRKNEQDESKQSKSKGKSNEESGSKLEENQETGVASNSVTNSENMDSSVPEDVQQYAGNESDLTESEEDIDGVPLDDSPYNTPTNAISGNRSRSQNEQQPIRVVNLLDLHQENRPTSENFIFPNMPSPPRMELMNDGPDEVQSEPVEEHDEEHDEEQDENDENRHSGPGNSWLSTMCQRPYSLLATPSLLRPLFQYTSSNSSDSQVVNQSENSSGPEPSSTSQEQSSSPSSQIQITAPPTASEQASTSQDQALSDNARNSELNEDVPEGVDPSFLDALPPEMRREVLEQHRMLRLQQRISMSGTSDQAVAGGSNEVSPEFLAALPLSLQEEVLTQQRLEQQRQAAARANPDEPVDAGAFFETLQPSLRTMILSDMEDSQMSVLPPDLAAEAQTLRRDWEARNRQMVQERFFQSNLTTIIRHSTRGRLGSRFSPQVINHRHEWNWSQRDIVPQSSTTPNIRIRGRQLLDHESLSCLLVLLFVDDPKLNTGRLHRVIRNLCYHVPTRDWVVKALLSIIDRSVHVKPDESLNKPKRLPRPGPLTSKLITDSKNMGNGANWLNIRMEAALGCHANVFIVNKVSGKRTNVTTVTIHPQAAPIVCRNALDLFTSLSRSFPTFLLPLKPKDKSKLPGPIKFKNENTDFWDMLLKLDAASTKKGKSLAKTHSNLNLNTETENTSLSFEQSAFGQLLVMLSSPVIRSSIHLTDKLLRLLSVISMGMPELSKSSESSRTNKNTSQHFESVLAPEAALNLAVSVLTYKSCSEEGLEEVTTLLLNMSNCTIDMSFMILNLLLKGALRIGEIVRSQIQDMLEELKNVHKVQKRKVQEEQTPSTSKGILNNRFTKEAVVITASSKVKTSCDLQLPSMVPLTSKSSSQIFFLRVLRVIVQIRDAIKKSLEKDEKTIHSQLSPLSDQLEDLENLWNTLSQCLLELEHTPDHHAVLVLQPAVEAFFLVHSPQQEANVSSDSSKSTNDSVQETTDSVGAGSSSQSQSNDLTVSSSDTTGRASVPPDQLKFLNFAEKHRTVLNQILRQTTAHLADGPFSVLVDHTRVLDFDIKRRYFRTELERLDQNLRREETAVHVRREHVFEDSFRELYRRTPEEWKNRFYIVFEDEEGQDAGGLLREWYVIISRDIFNPMYALFTVSPGDRVTYMINSASHYNPNHLCYYKFVGRVIAKAIYDNKLLECYFTRSFYKHILGIPVKYTDMESEDYSFYRGLVYLMENNINDLGCDLTFSTEINEFGVTETRDLITNGRNVPVTEENKMEYVRLSCQMKMTGAIRQQLTAFLEGFYDIIPKRLISIFNEQELELLISGLPNVDIEDLKANTEYHKYQATSLQIQWFWRALRSFDQADRAKFLQFVTGTSKVPLQGFGALEGMNGVQKFQIHRDDRSTDRLPSAHTCFNQLDLPVYETYDKLRSYLLKAIHECSEGFGFA